MSPERAFLIEQGTLQLPAILHSPSTSSPSTNSTTGVLIVVGGPQYRVGSHRQFVLLARALAEAGYPVLRFDHSGLGDAGGAAQSFENLDADLAAALESFFNEQATLERVVIWGLCDAASAALFYAWRDPRVAGLVLANPWVRTAASEAEAYLKHYYWSRLKNPEFWRKLLRGGLNLKASLASLLGFWKQRGQQASRAGKDQALSGTLPERMAEGWRRFNGPILLLLSGDDLTAREFEDVAAGDGPWTGHLSQPRVQITRLPAANHTFASALWREQVAEHTRRWLDQLPSTP